MRIKIYKFKKIRNIKTNIIYYDRVFYKQITNTKILNYGN